MAGEWTTIAGSDGFLFDAYRALPEGTPRGGIVVCHEIFSVNAYVRRCADFFAAQGYAVVAPRFFDRIERGVELDYVREDARYARDTFSKIIDRGQCAADLIAFAEAMGVHGKVAVVGYSWGATTTWVASGIHSFDCAVGYYAGTKQYSTNAPRGPLMLHQPVLDRRILPEYLDWLRAEHPAVALQTYDADHGFDCPDPGREKVYDPKAAALARDRTLAFISEHVG